MMREGGCSKLPPALTSFASGLEGSWGSDQRAAEVTPGWLTRSPRGVGEALACGWPVARQSINSKDSGIRKRLAQAAEWSNAYAAHLWPEHAEALRQEVGEALDAAVRSASLVENVDSALRPLRETCRGQVEQEMVEVLAYVHNHRRFVRGKRAGQAPIELLTGKALEPTWRDSL